MRKIITIVALITAGTVSAQWSNQPSGITNDLNNVHFVDNNTGWAVGRQGKIIRTTNGGSSWAEQNSGTTENMNSIYMVSASLGYAVGNNGKISKYDGASWSAVNTSETRDVFGVYFINENTGWAVGDWGRLYRTTNGGGSWTNQNNDAMASYKYNAVHMFSETDGFAVGTSGRIARYNGTNWVGQTSGVTGELLGAHFLNSNYGFAVGKNSTILFFNGSSWTTHNSALPDNSYSIYDVHIISATEAYAAASPGFGGQGVILRYNGSTWSIDYEYTGMGTELFYGINFSPQGKGFAVGVGGMIKTRNSATASMNPVIESDFTVSPNPFNESLTIHFDNQTESELTVEIMDLSGKVFYSESINHNFNGTHKISDLERLPKGLCIVRILGEHQMKTIKVIKI